jgi:hypothetical protein
MPAPYSLVELLTKPTPDQIRARFLALLGADPNPGLGSAFAHGFPVADWVENPDGMEMAFVDLVRSAIFDLVASPMPDQIASGWLTRARGLYLDYHAQTYYQLPRNGATRTTFNLALVSTASAPPYTFEPKDVVVSGPSGMRYVSTTGGALEPGGTLLMSFEAEAPGALYNDNPPFTLVTAFAGVSASTAVGDFTTVIQNGGGTGALLFERLYPEIAPTAGRYVFRIDLTGDPGNARFSLSFNGGDFAPQGTLSAAGIPLDFYGLRVRGVVGGGTPNSFIATDTYSVTSPGGTAYVQGNDAETDASLTQRGQARWPSLSANQTQDVFRLWTKHAYPSANRVSVRADPAAPGRVQVLVADINGAIDAENANAIANYITPKLGDVLASVDVRGATELAVVPAGTVTVPAAHYNSVQQLAQQAWSSYLSTVDIGGVVILAELQEAIMRAGALDVSGLTLQGVAGNLALNRNEVAVAGDLPTQLVWARA